MDTQKTSASDAPNGKKAARDAKLSLTAARIAYLAAYLFLPVSFWMCLAAGPWGLLYVAGDAALFCIAFCWGGRRATPAQHPVLSLLLVCAVLLALFYRA